MFVSNIVKVFGLVLLIVFFDQLSKLFVHFNVLPGASGQIRLIGDFVKIYYVTNPGMAFGMSFGIKYGKLLLTIIRLLAVIAIGRFIFKETKKISFELSLFIVSWIMILGGAIGNLFDSVFYGVFLNNAPLDSITPWFHGEVIDMIYFDLWTIKVPDWVPLFSGSYIRGFPIFNVADSFITVGVFLLLLSNYRYKKIDFMR